MQASHRARSMSGVLQVSSIASHVSATTTIASSRQQLTQGSMPASESDPFAALLDALAAQDPNVTTMPAAGQQAAQPVSNPPETPPAKPGNSATVPRAVDAVHADRGHCHKAGQVIAASYAFETHRAQRFGRHIDALLITDLAHRGPQSNSCGPREE